jgi:hypothetical protein
MRNNEKQCETVVTDVLLGARGCSGLGRLHHFADDDRSTTSWG